MSTIVRIANAGTVCGIVLSMIALPAAETAAPAALLLNSPLDYQVFQRDSRSGGEIRIDGSRPGESHRSATLEIRLRIDGKISGWERLAVLSPGETRLSAKLRAPAGGWHRLEVRVRQDNAVLAETAVPHVGVGEVFVIAGQSNAANHGEEKQETRTGLVAALHEGKWQLAQDPQPGASGTGGSFIPPFGDTIAEQFKVPVGIIAAGVGATSVREWLPRGSRFPNPPTLTRYVTPLPSGEWESTGTLFDRLVARIEPLGPRGFRAVLWHQGESDANQQDPSRTLPGELYKKFLAQLIRETQREAGWEFPWFVAQASYHSPEDTGSPDIRAAQAALWKTGAALEGPDTDALTGRFRDQNGRGVHLSGPGLREHGKRWAEKVAPWLEHELGLRGSKPPGEP